MAVPQQQNTWRQRLGDIAYGSLGPVGRAGYNAISGYNPAGRVTNAAGQQISSGVPSLQQLQQGGVVQQQLPGGGLYEQIFGSPAYHRQFPAYSSEQLGGIGAILNQGLGALGGQQLPVFGQFDFNPIAQEARDQFNTKTIPSLAERFTALPGQGGQRSSAFQGALGSAGAGLEKGLASLRSEYGLKQQAMQLPFIQNLLQLGLRSPFESQAQPAQPGALSSGFGALLQLLPYLAGL